MELRKTRVPPIKSQGIKTKLVPWINSVLCQEEQAVWVEPFFGTGVVGFNVKAKKYVLCDANPHLVNFYSRILEKKINPSVVSKYLHHEGSMLERIGEDYYYSVRDRFNTYGDPLDFLFLNRSGFNGMIRFNRKGQYNIPFCKKTGRFAPPYITKITNQVKWVYDFCDSKDITFKYQDFLTTISESSHDSIIYCDPPYIDRHVDYYNTWQEEDEQTLSHLLSQFPGRFILSTWHHNTYRKNIHIDRYWGEFYMRTKDHFYHVGANEKNRGSITEALIMNFAPPATKENILTKHMQIEMIL